MGWACRRPPGDVVPFVRSQFSERYLQQPEPALLRIFCGKRDPSADAWPGPSICPLCLDCRSVSCGPASILQIPFLAYYRWPDRLWGKHAASTGGHATRRTHPRTPSGRQIFMIRLAMRCVCSARSGTLEQQELPSRRISGEPKALSEAETPLIAGHERHEHATNAIDHLPRRNFSVKRPASNGNAKVGDG